MNGPGRFRRFVIGADLGATHCRAAIFSRKGEMGNRLEKRFPAGSSGEQDLETFYRIVDDLLAGEPGSALLAIGVGSFGPIDRERERVVEAPNRPGWIDVPVRALLANRYGVPVVLENDANVATFGEYRRGAGRGTESLLGLTLGTGIGGGFVRGGEILVGAAGMAVEAGHIYIGGDGIRCGCGAVDCLEVYASAEGIKKSYLRASGVKEELSCHAIFHLAREGDETASATIARSAALLGRGIASLQKILDPERIIVGGGLSREWDLFVRPAAAEAVRFLFRTQRDRFDLRRADLGTDAGLYGAAELALAQTD